MRTFVALTGLLLCFPALAFAGEGSGAKDLFYDPLQGSALSVQMPVRIPVAAPAAALSPDQPATRPAHKAMSTAIRRPVVQPSGSAATAKNRGLHYWIELEEADGEGSYVTDRTVFHSGQRIRLHFVSNADGHILLIQTGASGTSTMLFPDLGKGLADNRLKASEDRILPSEASWFRFDAHAGTERLVVLFARDAAELDRFPVKSEMTPAETAAVMRTASRFQGSKDLVIETETRTAAEIGTYGINSKGEPVVLEISLRHR